MPTTLKELSMTEASSFSRFETNLRNMASLPIYQISPYSSDGMGVLMVGDYIAEELCGHMDRIGIRKKWLVISTTQSDAVPTNCKSVDFNMFTNDSGIPEYLNSNARQVPFSTELGDGHFVDQDIFYPQDGFRKTWDILYPAKYSPTKKTELLLEVARTNPDINIAIVGWPVVSERKAKLSSEYRSMIIEAAKGLPNVTVFDNSPDEHCQHVNPDGSIVVGKYDKNQMRDIFYSRARSVIFLSEETEAVNRACTEALCCNIPILVSSSRGGLDKLVNEKTGVIIDRSPAGIVSGLITLNTRKSTLEPRAAFLNEFGRKNANVKLLKIIEQAARGANVNWAGCVEYGGDLWTNYSTYSRLFENR